MQQHKMAWIYFNKVFGIMFYSKVSVSSSFFRSCKSRYCEQKRCVYGDMKQSLRFKEIASGFTKKRRRLFSSIHHSFFLLYSLAQMRFHTKVHGFVLQGLLKL